MWRASRVLSVDRAGLLQMNPDAEQSYLVTSFQHNQETEAYENTPKSESITTGYLPSKVVCIYEALRRSSSPQELQGREDETATIRVAGRLKYSFYPTLWTGNFSNDRTRWGRSN